jgi:hypothetical protein
MWGVCLSYFSDEFIEHSDDLRECMYAIFNFKADRHNAYLSPPIGLVICDEGKSDPLSKANCIYLS